MTSTMPPGRTPATPLKRSGDRVGQAAGLDDDGVEVKPWVGELGQRIVESAVVRQAAHTAAGDRLGFVDLAGDQPCIYV